MSARSRGESRSTVRAWREIVARDIAAAPTDERKLAILDRAIAADGATISPGRGVDYRLQLLGRTATCTSSAKGARWNWIRAALREFGLCPQDVGRR